MGAFVARGNSLVAQALVVALGVVVLEILVHHATYRASSEEDHLGQAFGPNAQMEALQVCIQVRALGW